MIYTNVPKPTGPTYTTTNNAVGKQQYNQSDITYSQSSVFYNGINTNQYTNIAKPSLPSYTKVAKPV